MAKEPVKAKRRANRIDEESEAMIFQGCNITQLGKMLGMERRDITPKIQDVAPCGQRGGYDIYNLKEVLPYLVKPLYDVETYIRRMHPSELPKMLSKEFWNGMKAKQDYELREGELWPTEQVESVISESYKLIRMSLLLIPDALERESTLTDHQRSRIMEMIDGALNEMASGITAAFGERAEKANRNGEIIENGEV
ncbi:terminase small subunit [Providencia phage Kokobel1]|uniref:Terminase small subunit n=1 Tax=Providencia phage Kokobel1 TaxID=2783540 RepID=A0A873WG87_9CAUD|nr:terminase small subunit [Providencia phage Kokobel1]QPB11463.1 terminase small subunit [Providencia phage Kokobel1]